MVFFGWRLWLRNAVGLEKIAYGEPCIIVSNHSSYFDFFVLASVLKKQTVFVAVKKLDQRSFVGWFMRLDTIVYVDRERPGYKFFKELIYHLKNQKRVVVIYPEGTRSRSGKMLFPKAGFVKIALKTNVPVIPLAMKGTYDILPPHKKFPAFKRCDVVVGDKIVLGPQNPDFADCFFGAPLDSNGSYRLSDSQIEEIAYRVMEKVRNLAGIEWDESAVAYRKKMLAPPQDVVAQ
jgi:1-acyl-sn-glycerol-3-phosphate acyltransferase